MCFLSNGNIIDSEQALLSRHDMNTPNLISDVLKAHYDDTENMTERSRYSFELFECFRSIRLKMSRSRIRGVGLTSW